MNNCNKTKKSRLKHALQQTQEDLAAGRFKVATVEEHMEDVKKDMNNA